MIEKIICINLPRDKKRREDSEKLFEKHGIQVEFIEAYDGYELDNGIISGYNALTKTLIEVVKNAKEKNLKNILILEDDNDFVPDFNDRLNSALDILPEDFGVLYLSFLSVGPMMHYSVELYNIQSAMYGNAFLLNNIMFDDFLAELEKYQTISDVSLMNTYLDGKYRAFGLYPCLAWQCTGHSSVLGVDVDNSRTGDVF